MTKPYHGEPDGLMNNAWRNFSEVVPERLDEISRFEMRFAFYCGGTAVLQAIFKALINDDPDLAGAKFHDTMQRLDLEVRRFAQAFKSGQVR